MTVTAFVTAVTPATTTHFQRPDRCEIPHFTERKPKRPVLRMKWVVVIGKNGGRSLRTHWATVTEPRL